MSPEYKRALYKQMEEAAHSIYEVHCTYTLTHTQLCFNKFLLFECRNICQTRLIPGSR